MLTEAWVSPRNAALFADWYELTMLQAYHREGMNGPAVFDLFLRRMGARNYLLGCGLETVLDYLEALRFTDETLECLRRLGPFDDAFLSRLEAFRFTGTVYAMPEGTVCFAEEPLIQVAAPLGEAQIVETFLLNQCTFQTGVASKAARVVLAAAGRDVVDFGMRRAHGADAALRGARACCVAGFAGTSNALAACAFGLPPVGTMAHSYIQAHPAEAEAFSRYAALYPGATLLVDTYDTLGGVRTLITLYEADPEGFRVGAIRLDSGDLAALAREARRLLDAAGLRQIRILASSSLDEHRVAELVAAGAPIDGFGVGTRVGALADQPYLDSVYKLTEYNGEGRMKLSAAKSNLPGLKQVYRAFSGDEMQHDTVAARDEAPPEGVPMLERVMHEGRRTRPPEPLEETRDRARRNLAALPAALRALEPAPAPYPVRVSPELARRTEALRRRLR